ncbi:MAG: amidohydrolase [Clostridia bacterium]
MDILIKNARVYSMDVPPIECGYIIIKNGKFESVGDMHDVPTWSGDTFDAHGAYTLPGLVDAHTHIGLFNEGLRFEGEDGNEDTDPITPQLRAIDAVYPQDGAFSEARLAGVSTVVTGPGSANPIGGQFTAIKTCGTRVDDMIIEPCAAIKFALGENPKMTYNEKDRGPVTRMATASLLRETLMKTIEYMDNREEDDDCDLDFKLEALIPLIEGSVPAQIHCHRADDIFTAIRIAKEFNIDFVLVHCTEGHLIADALARENAKIITGPFMTCRTKPELAHQNAANAAILARAGVRVAICSDYPETQQDALMLSAALAAREGLSDEEAFKMITINAAEIAGISARVGSIKQGKDADIVMYSGHPFDLRSRVCGVWQDGERIV